MPDNTYSGSNSSRNRIVPEKHYNAGKTILNKQLPDSLSDFNRVKKRLKKRLTQYVFEESLTTYMIETYGMEKFLQFVMTVPVTESVFEETYNMSYKEMENEWKDFILESESSSA